MPGKALKNCNLNPDIYDKNDRRPGADSPCIAQPGPKAQDINVQDTKVQDTKAQDTKASDFNIPVPAGATLNFQDFPGDVPIEGYNGSDVIIGGQESVGVPDRARGLKPIYPEGKTTPATAWRWKKTETR